MRAAVLLLMLLPIHGAVAAPSIHAIVPDLPGSAPGDEGFAITTDTAWNLTGAWITDGEGRLDLPHRTLDAGDVAWFTGNATAWAPYGPAAETWRDESLRLANDGDNLELYGPDGTVWDSIAWGDGVLPRATKGAMLVQENGTWALPRFHRIGESALAQPSFAADSIKVFAAPDAAHATILEHIESASDRLIMHVYDLRSPDVARAVANQAARGVPVDVLVDGNVVAQDAYARQQRNAALSTIASSGGNVATTTYGRYVHHHLKVIIADNATLATSENFVPSSLNPTGTAGSRGWGVVVYDEAMANWFAAWMAADRTAWDVQPFSATGDQLIDEAPAHGKYSPRDAQDLEGPIRVTPIISPDHTARPGALSAALENATRRVWTQQLRMDDWEANALGWSREDRFSRALSDAAAIGLDVRIHLAGPFSRDDTRNADRIAALQEARATEALVWSHPHLGVLHNKGWIIDDAVVVGSMNGHHHSRSANREVSLLIENPAAAEYFAKLFKGDSARHGHLLPVASLPTLLVTMGVVASLRQSCSRFHPSLPSQSS